MPHTGQPVKRFGENGIVDLKRNDDQQIDPVTADIGLHATPLVAGDTVVVGAAHLAQNVPKHRSNAKGYVRGFDVRTGRRQWIFHTIPRKGEFGYDTWLHAGDAEQAGNGGMLGPALRRPGAWPCLSADRACVRRLRRHLSRRAPLCSAKPWSRSTSRPASAAGITRPSITDCGTATCPAPRSCATFPHDGRIVKALAQPSKQAFLYVLNRETGEPIWPIAETPAPAGDVPGEWYSPTQPIPSKPPAYDVQSVNADTI